MVYWHIYESSGDYREKRLFDNPPKEGDIIEMLNDGKPEPYKVARVYRHFDTENKVTFRVDVAYDGEAFFGVM